MSVTGGIQPDALGDLIDDAREDGFAARILFAYPDPIPNGDWNEETVKERAQYAGICESLWNLDPSDDPIKLSPAAKEKWVAWVNSHRKETPRDNLRPFWSKCEGYCARLARVLYLARRACNETKSIMIDPLSVTGAVKLIDYFKSHARRVFRAMADQSDKGRIGNALRWIRKHSGTVTARKAKQYGLCKDTEEVTQLFNDLADLKHGSIKKESRGSVVFRLAESKDPATT